MTSLPRVQDTCDDFETILGGIFCINFLNLVTYARKLRITGDCFKTFFTTHLRCLSPAVVKQSQSSEIGALRKTTQKLRKML